MKRNVAIAAIAVAALFLASCGDGGILKRIMDIDERASKGAPPSTIDELKAGIAKYEKTADKVVDATEHIGTYWQMLAVKYLDKTMYGEALEAALKAVEYFPASPGAYYVAGVSAGYVARADIAKAGGSVLAGQKSYAVAEATLKRAVELDDRHANSLYALSILYVFELNRPLDAEPYIRKFLSIRTRDVDAMFVLARVCYVTERYKEAVELYDSIMSITKLPEKKAQAEANKKQALEAMYAGQ